MFANKKIWISGLLVAVLFFSGLLAFVIIPNELNKFRPASWEKGTSTASVSGNGGTAVMVGHYLYFTSGYVSRDDIKYKQNEYNHKDLKKQGMGGIWRVKMTGGNGGIYDATPGYDNGYLENHLREIDYNDGDYQMYLDLNRHHTGQAPEIAAAMDKYVRKGNIELIVPKIAGWENAALWIMGNNLVYTTPNNEQDRKGALQTGKIDYFSCSLTGANNKRIYTTRNNIDPGAAAHTVVWVGNRAYLLVRDGARMVRVSMSGSVAEVSSNVENHVFPFVQSYYSAVGIPELDASREASYDGIMGYVYYTVAKAEDSEITGNQLWRYDIRNNKSAQMPKAPNATVRLLALGNGKLVYEIDNNNTTDLYITGDIGVSHDANDKQTVSIKELMESEQPVIVAGERTTAFQYFIVGGTSISMGTVGQTPTPLVNNLADGAIPRILAITAAGIVCELQGGGYRTIGFDGATISETGANTFGESGYSILGNRVNVFHKLNKDGARISETGDLMLFFNTEIKDAAAGEGSIAAAVFNTPIMMTVDGARDYVLAQLDTRYIKLPAKKLNTGEGEHSENDGHDH